jgi:hypothetical protein
MSSQKSNSLRLRELSLTTNVLTVVVDSGFFRNLGRLVAGATVQFSGVGINTFLNGTSIALTSVTALSPNRWTLVGPVTHANVLLSGDSGDVFVSNPVTDAGSPSSDPSQFPAWVRADMAWKESQAQVVSDGGAGVSN